MDSERAQLGFLLLMATATVAVGLGAFKRRRRYKTRPMNRQRQKLSVFENIVKFAEQNDAEQFFKYTRMSSEMFNHLLTLLEPRLQKDITKKPISPKHRLAITLHYLSEGCSIQEIAWNNYIGKATAHCIIKETCQVLWDVLQPIVLPEQRESLRNNAKENFRRWNFPNCIGSVDGKHVQIQCPRHSGSTYFSYKKSYSMVLMAARDAYYKFTYVDIGAAGANHDSAVFQESSYGRALLNGTLPISPPEPLPGTTTLFNFFLLLMQPFPYIEIYLMRPYPGTYLDDRKNIFNMRLSRVRRTIENAFGILAQRWRRLRNPIIANEDMCQLIIMATVVLHNYIQKGEEELPINERRYCPTGFIDWEDDNGVLHGGRWRDMGKNLRNMQRVGSNNYSRSVQECREILADWLISPIGAIVHQWEQLYHDRVPDCFRHDN